MTQPRLGVPDLGIGVGLRVPHYRHILSERPAMDFFEIISENFMVEGGKPIYHLEAVMESYSLIQHGVSLGIGAPEPPSREYLQRLKKLVKKVQPAWLSDHFCWCGVPGGDLHDLLPLPYTREMVARVSERARQVQDFLEVPFALENTSSYMSYRQSEMTEWEFVSEVVERADIGLMFDVNNVYVSASNHGFDALEFIEAVPHERIMQIHLAGHTNVGKYIIDTHRGPIIEEVWKLYGATIQRAGAVSTLIEWDDQIPEWAELDAEARRARQVRDAALASRQAGTLLADNLALPALDAVPTAAPSTAFSHGGPREAAGREASRLGKAVGE